MWATNALPLRFIKYSLIILKTLSVVSLYNVALYLVVSQWRSQWQQKLFEFSNESID